MAKLKRSGLFTDLHFGRKNNSKMHNQDCTDFIDWACEQFVKHEVDHVDFLGDWFEERDSINSLTSKYALDCAKKLNNLGIPVYFIVGNHDLYYRDNREVFASYVYETLDNFVIIDHPVVRNEMIHPTLYCPFLFEDEYPDLAKYFDVPIWKGHFEFKGFVLTGDTYKKEDGPDPDHYTAPRKIFSGHFHKRQHSKNIYYIGNTFPMDFGDVNDVDRGVAIYDYEDDKIEYVNWPDCPRYIRMDLSDLSDKAGELRKTDRVKCNANIEITYSEHSAIKQTIMNKLNLREFNIEEKPPEIEVTGELTEDELQTETTNSLVRKFLKSITSDDLDNVLLLNIYDGL